MESDSVRRKCNTDISLWDRLPRDVENLILRKCNELLHKTRWVRETLAKYHFEGHLKLALMLDGCDSLWDWLPNELKFYIFRLRHIAQMRDVHNELLEATSMIRIDLMTHRYYGRCNACVSLPRLLYTMSTRKITSGARYRLQCKAFIEYDEIKPYWYIVNPQRYTVACILNGEPDALGVSDFNFVVSRNWYSF